MSGVSTSSSGLAYPMSPEDSLTSCESVCNITIPQWCENFVAGLRTSHCSDDKCAAKLCKSALECQEDYLRQQDDPFLTGDGYCPIIFDGWACINSTRAGEIANISCPDFEHLNFHNENYAYRECSSEGIWFDSFLQKSYTRYAECPDVKTFQWYETIIKIYVAGYSISLLFLFISTFIFLHFRSLRCVRNTIHTNLFIACILHNVSWLFWYYAVQQEMGGISNWSAGAIVGCKLLNTMFNYFMVCTYFWMLCEGLYLFIVLIVTFVSEKRVLIGLCLLGWGFPALLVLIYVLLRVILDDTGHEHCWMYDSAFNWVYKIPCIVSVSLNLVFLAWIVHVLVSKLHSDVSDHAAIVKTARAVGVLVPLFGLHNFLAAFKPDNEQSSWRIIIELTSAVTISFQGMVVAILFCLINSEVLTQLKRFLDDRIDPNRHQSLAMTQYTYVRPPNNASPRLKLKGNLEGEENEDVDTKTTYV